MWHGVPEEWADGQSFDNPVCDCVDGILREVAVYEDGIQASGSHAYAEADGISDHDSTCRRMMSTVVQSFKNMSDCFSCLRFSIVGIGACGTFGCVDGQQQ